MKSREGFALAVTIIVLGVVLVSVVATMSLASLGVRRGASDERRGLQSLLVAESGLNVFAAVAAERAQLLPTRDEELSDENWRASLNLWLSEQEIATVNVGEGREAQLQVTNVFTMQDEEDESVIDVFTVRSVSWGAGGEHTAALDFMVWVRSANISVFAPAALTSKPNIRVGGNAVVSGSTGIETDWLGSTSTTTNAGVIFLDIDGGATVPVSAGFADTVLPGEYVELDDVDGTSARFRVVSKTAESLTVNRVGPSSAFGAIQVLGPITHVPLAVTGDALPRELDGVDRARIPVTYPEFFRVGSQLIVEYGLGGGDHYLNVVGFEDGDLLVEAEPGSVLPSPYSGYPLYEGTTTRAYVTGAISDGSITVVGGSEITPPEEPFASLPDDLVMETFGVDVAGLREIALAAGGYYADWGSVPDVENLSGITFIETSTSSNVQFCGSGIVFVNGDLMSNNAGCPFSGLVFVLGDWSERGNRQIQGAVVVEGIVETCSEVDDAGNCITDIMGTGQGSDKIEYDPLVLYNLGFDLAPGQVSVVERPGSWRLVGAN